jgi:PAS domain S-box-containing protein
VAAAEQLAFVLHDVSADAGPRFICRTRGRGASELSVAEPDLVYAADLPVANRIWRIEIRPTVAFVASNTERGHWFVFVAGVLLTLLMVMLLVSQLHEAAFLQSLLADHEQQELRNALRLKSRVLLSAVGVAVLFAALGLAFVYVSVHRQSASQTGHLAEAAAYEFQRALAAEARTLRAQAVGIEGSAALAAAWLGGDWQAVRALTSPQFEQLERELGAERIALLDADRIVRSGAGSASGCEAEVGRQATSAARQRGDEAWGLELASGGVRLVYARPLRWGGQIRGYCKMDVSVDGVLARLSTPGTRQLVLLDERDRPVSGVLPSGLEAAIRRQPARAMTGVFELQASAADGRNEGRRWSCRMVPERDVTGSPTVQLLVMRSTDSDVAFRRRLMVVLVLAAILVAVVLLVVLSQVAGGMEKRLGAAVIARERAHQARQLTEGILSSTLRSIGDGVISVDADKRITLMNTRAESLTGWSQAEAAGKPLDDVCRIVGAPAGASVDRALALGQTVSQAVEATLMARDGSRRQVTDSAALMRDEHGRVSGVVLVLRDVTAENVTRRELQAKKQELERYFSNSLDLLCIADTDGYFRRMNPEWERTLGYTLEELEGKFYPTFVHPEDVAATLETLANLGDQKTVLSFTNRFRAKDGRYRSIEWRSLPQGNLIYSAARDVTERRQAEDALRAGEERLARINTCLLQRTADCDGNVNRLTALAGELMGAMCALYARVDDANGCLTLCGRWCVPGGVYATGLPAGSICHEAIQGDSGDILYVTDLQASAFAAADEFVRTQGFGCCVAHVVRSGEGKPVGSLCVLFAGERVLQATDRQILGILAAAVESEEAHREAEAGLRRLASAINQAAESVLITNAAGVIEYVNPAFERTSGYSRGEVVGRTPALLKSGQHDTVFYRNLRQTLAGGSMWSGRFINRRKNGTLYQEDATISPVCDENGRVVQFVAVQKDVTHEVELQDQLQQAQRMEAVGLLAGGVAHDLNNLLAPILGYGEMLLVDHSLDKPRRRDLVEMIKAAERARDLVRQLMAFGRKQALDVKLLDVNAVVADFSELMRSTLREDIRLDMRLAHGLPCVKADRGQLEQVLMNLAMNAQEAMPHGGALVIETAAVDVAGELAVSQAGVGPGRCVTLTVSDSGVGMDEQTLARVFDPFFTTKEMGKGMGLGLATVYGIVKQHGGGIRAHSAPGCGATFRIHLPASRLRIAAPATRHAAAARAWRHRDHSAGGRRAGRARDD